ncbi:AMP-binding protein [Methylobacterium oryzae CBMB20]
MHEAKVIEPGAPSRRNPAATPACAGRSGHPARPWLASYPPRRPGGDRRARASARWSICSRPACAAFAERPAMLCFGSADDLCDARPAGARPARPGCSGQGLAKGDRVAIMLPNVPAYAVAIFGVLLAGGIGGQHQPALHPRECAQQINDSGRADPDRPGEFRRHRRGVPAATWRWTGSSSSVRATGSGSRAR